MEKKSTETHINCPRVVGEGLIGEDEDPVLVVGLGEPGHSLRPLPQSSDLHVATRQRTAGRIAGPVAVHGYEGHTGTLWELKCHPNTYS